MHDDFAPKPFTCEELPRDGDVYLRPSGDLDIRTAPVLEERIRSAREMGATRVVVDLSRLDFMDSTGITLVTRYNNEARRDGFDFALIKGSPRVMRLFDLTGLGDYFTFIDG
jgi:anti-sigma B factor antagonist